MVYQESAYQESVYQESVYQEMVYQEMTFFWCTGVEKHIKMNKKMTGAPYFDEFLSHRSLFNYLNLD
jgi:hypothetical protein